MIRYDVSTPGLIDVGRLAWLLGAVVVGGACARELAEEQIRTIRPRAARVVREAGFVVCRAGYRVAQLSRELSGIVGGCGCDDDDAINCMREVNETGDPGGDNGCRCPCHQILRGAS